MGGRQCWVMLVDEATKYKKSFFLKKKNEQVEPIIDWIKSLKARHIIQVKIIRLLKHNQIRTDRRTVELRFNWEYVLNCT